MIWSRRALLQTAAAPILPGLAPPITRVEAAPVGYPLAGSFKFFTGNERPTVMVKVTCESGAVGWGQSVPTPSWSYETAESVISTIRQHLAPVLIGGNPFDIDGAHRAMNKAIAPSFSTGMPIAKAGVDLALHDLCGKLRGQNMPERWGRQPLARIPLSWTVNPRDLGETELLVQQGLDRGYRHFNVKLAPDPVYDVEMTAIVRRLAPKAFLWGDANGGYDLARAKWAAPRLANLGMNVLEQPLPSNRLSGYRELKRQGALPILLDEGVVSAADLVEFLRLGLMDGVAMKPARTGGLWHARKQIEILEEAGLLVLGSGLTDPDVALAAALQLYAAFQLTSPAALNAPQFLAGSILTLPLPVENGEIAVPLGPGLGVEVDETKVLRGKAS